MAICETIFYDLCETTYFTIMLQQLMAICFNNGDAGPDIWTEDIIECPIDMQLSMPCIKVLDYWGGNALPPQTAEDDQDIWFFSMWADDGQ